MKIREKIGHGDFRTGTGGKLHKDKVVKGKEPEQC